MKVSHLEILVEEPSTEALLRVLLPHLLSGMTFEIHGHKGKPDLLRKLGDRLRGYAHWIDDTTRILVIVDRDRQNCRELKQELEKIAAESGLPTRAKNPARWTVATRIAIEELEAWYFGEWGAVRAAYPRAPAGIPTRTEYRDPDAILGGTWEAFERVLQGAGYFAGGLRKIEAARAIAPHMRASSNRSASFQALNRVLQELAWRVQAGGEVGTHC
jgi:Domain of unknown function (DUF4276)